MFGPVRLVLLDDDRVQRAHPPALLVPLVPDDALGDVRRRDPGQRRDVVRAVRDRGRPACTATTCRRAGECSTRPGSTSSSSWAGSACSRRRFLLFIRFVPMVALSEVKACLPQADPHHRALRDGGGRAAEIRPAESLSAAKRDWRPGLRRCWRGSAGPAELLAAAERLRAAGYRRFDTYSPFPIHGMDRALGLGRSKVPLFTLRRGPVRRGVRPVDPVVPERCRLSRWSSVASH